MASQNSEETRPNVSYTLPRELIERLNGLSKGEKSAFVEEALRTHLDDRAARQEATRQVMVASEYLFNNAQVFETRQEVIEARLASVEANLEFISSALERLFHIRRWPPVVEVPTNKEFVDLVSDASTEYIRNRDLLAPTTSGPSELERAAASQAHENRLKELEDLLKAMPFMEDPRFYVSYASLGGIALYDREFKETEKSSVSPNGHFPVISVIMYRGEVTVRCPVKRPYFELGSGDYRVCNIISGPHAVAEISPLIVADYIAFRQLNGSIPAKTLNSPNGADADVNDTSPKLY